MDNTLTYLNITVTSGAKINKIGEKGHLQIKSRNKILIVRKDYTPILYVAQHRKLEIYEIETLTDYEKFMLNSIYKGFLLELDYIYKPFTALITELDIIDYHKLFHIKSFLCGKVTIYEHW